MAYSVTTPVTAAAMVAKLLAPVHNLSSVSAELYQGAAVAAGIYSGAQEPLFGTLGPNGLYRGLSIDEGVVLSTGKAVFTGGGPQDIQAGAGAYSGADQESVTYDNQIGGHEPPPSSILLSGRIAESYSGPLATLIGQPTTEIFDAVSLSFTFVPKTANIRWKFWYTSFEYDEFISELYVDGFGAFLDGTNIALIPGTALRLMVNEANQFTLTGGLAHFFTAFSGAFFLSGSDLTWYQIGGNGLVCDTDGTVAGAGYGPVVIEAAVTPNVAHTMQFLIGDAFDSIYDTAVFLAAGSFEAYGPIVPVGPALSPANQTDSSGGNGATDPALGCATGLATPWVGR